MTMNASSIQAEKCKLHYLAEQTKPRTLPKARTTTGKPSKLLCNLMNKEISK